MAAIELVWMSELTCKVVSLWERIALSIRGKPKCCMAHYRRPSTTSSGPHVRELETQELYREAFDVASHAVQLDNSGVHAEAREAYIDAIQVYKCHSGPHKHDHRHCY
jgi:hypothetical protein